MATQLHTGSVKHSNKVSIITWCNDLYAWYLYTKHMQTHMERFKNVSGSCDEQPVIRGRGWTGVGKGWKGGAHIFRIAKLFY